MKTKYVAALILFSSVFVYSQAPRLSWGYNIGSALYDYVTGIQADGNGDYIIAGTLHDSIRFGNNIFYSGGSTDIYTAKFGKYGDFKGVNTYGTPGTDYVDHFVMDNQNNIIVSGNYYSPPQYFDYYYYISKYEPGGGMLWEHPVRGYNFYLTNLAADAQNNIYAAGYFYDSVLISRQTLKAAGNTDAYILKFTQNGELEWARTIGIPLHYFSDSKLSLIMNDNYIILAGSYYYYNGTFVDNKFYYSMYSSSGTQLWFKEASSEGEVNISSISSNQDGEFFITGLFNSPLVIDDQSYGSDSSRSFIARFSADGSLKWFKDLGESIIFNKTASDLTGNLYAVGNTYSEESSRLVMQKYNRRGELTWSFFNRDFESRGKDLIIDIEGNVILTGTFMDSLTLGNITLYPYGDDDIFIMKIPAPVLDGSSQSVDFGTMTIGNSISSTVYIYNPGLSDVLIDSMLVTGQNSSEFSINLSENLILEPSYVIPLEITFSPATSGNKIAQVFAETDAVTGPVSISLTGFGDIPRFVASSDTVKFGIVNIREEKRDSFNVYNNSTLTLKILNADISGNIYNDFSIVNKPDSILPFENSWFVCSFIPQLPGLKEATLFIQSNAEGSPHTISLRGEGVESAITLKDSLEFTQCSVYDSVYHSYSILNEGSTDLIVNSISINGVNSSDFFAHFTLPLPVIAPLGTFEFQVYFRPLTPGRKSAYLVIESNSRNSPDSTFLTGRATIPLQVSVQSGESISIAVQPQQSYDFNENYLFFKLTGETEYKTSPFNFTGEEYYAMIPAEDMTIRGIQYYVSFSDGETQLTYPEDNPAINPAYLYTKYSNYRLPLDLSAMSYRMITIPLVPDDLSLNTAVLNNFGPSDPKLWRLLQWNSRDSVYIDFPGFDNTIIPGKAYWFISAEPKNFSLSDVTSVVPYEPYSMTIIPGWNQIGNPYVFRIDWPETDTLLSLPVYWDVRTSTYFYEQTQLIPWIGYWIYNESDYSITVNVLPVESDTVYVFTGRNENEFMLKLHLSSGKGFHDEIYLGMLDNPLRNNNVYKPPSTSNELSAGIISDSKIFAKNMKKRSAEGEYWDFSVQSMIKDNVELRIEYLDPLPEDFDIWILDLNSNKSLPVYKNYVRLTPGNNGLYRIITGTREYAENNSGKISLIPSELTLYQNFPNPFNPYTTIAYSLPERGIVKLILYDALGREIKMLANEEQSTGLHEVELNMLEYASGIYFYSIHFKNSRLTKKLILLK
jgi:hypothetical protein